jgi:hypothetical protein
LRLHFTFTEPASTHVRYIYFHNILLSVLLIISRMSDEFNYRVVDEQSGVQDKKFNMKDLPSIITGKLNITFPSINRILMCSFTDFFPQSVVEIDTEIPSTPGRMPGDPPPSPEAMERVRNLTRTFRERVESTELRDDPIVTDDTPQGTPADQHDSIEESSASEKDDCSSKDDSSEDEESHIKVPTDIITKLETYNCSTALRKGGVTYSSILSFGKDFTGEWKHLFVEDTTNAAFVRLYRKCDKFVVSDWKFEGYPVLDYPITTLPTHANWFSNLVTFIPSLGRISVFRFKKTRQTFVFNTFFAQIVTYVHLSVIFRFVFADKFT